MDSSLGNLLNNITLPSPWRPAHKPALLIIAILALLDTVVIRLRLKFQFLTLIPESKSFSGFGQMSVRLRITFAAFFLVLMAVGLGFGLTLWSKRKSWSIPEALRWTMPWESVLLLVLGWMLVHQVSGMSLMALTLTMPSLRNFYLPIQTSLSAGFGLWILIRLEGIRFSQLWSGLTLGKVGPSLGWGLGYFTLIPFAVISARILTYAFSGNTIPQAGELTYIRNIHGPIPVMLAFLTIVVLGPIFEEVLFRGFLLNWMAGRMGWGWSILTTSLLFGLAHFNLAALPALVAVGLVLGFAMRRSGSLLSSVLIHALINGSTFVLIRLT